jgi:hypothetical protein
VEVDHGFSRGLECLGEGVEAVTCECVATVGAVERHDSALPVDTRSYHDSS